MMEKQYQPKTAEEKIYAFWQEKGFFNPDNLKAKRHFSIVIPPPNVTGGLHMGHALNAVIQDIIVRQKRMAGFKTVWVPGTDHAGIATQNAVEKALKKQGKTRFDLGREKFIQEVWRWKEKYGDIILDQLKKLGVSCDWSRARFTMDKDYVKAVETAFLYYYKKGWIYRGERVINWCPRCQTSLSDLELEYKEEKSNLWFVKYPIKESQKSKVKSQKYIIVATTRPETMLGDTAVAVHSQDKRYAKLIGEKVILPLANREIPIIADGLIDRQFGTGAVKVTPAHDLNDEEMGRKHNLKSIQVINDKGEITKEAPIAYQGLKVLEAREKIINDLRALGLIEKIEDYIHQIPKCYRCDTTVELIPSEQWFLKMGQLAQAAIKPVKEGKIKFHPKRFEKGYLDWLTHIRDWCISRQLWWGHKIPIEGADDVLDTWFSSALWPFAVFGWPQKTKDLKEFYPTDILVTARDIINLWVSRMVFSSRALTQKLPFKDVLIHATVLTKTGKRMSKSLGIGIDPLAMVEKYGADATRFGLAWQISENQDMHFGEEDILAGKKFCNKLWNASRFVLSQASDKQIDFKKPKAISPEDKKILSDLDKLIKITTKEIAQFRFGQSLQKIYHFFWHNFCDIYIEKAKIAKDKENAKLVLFYILFNSLKLLHPFLPFITETIYQKLPLKNKTAIIIENWPE